MTKIFIRCSLAFTVAILGLNGFRALEVRGQSPVINALSASESVDGILDKGLDFEREHRWQEAIQLYEKAFRKHPDSAALDRRLKIVRIHFDVVRRYTDSTFIQSVDRLSQSASLDLFSEVLAKLELNYVETVDLAELIRNGTAYLEVALTEKDFIAHNLPNAPASSVEQFRANIHKSVIGRPVKNRDDARSIVAQVAGLAQKQLGLAPTTTIHEYVAGVVGLLDPYSGFLTAGELHEVMSQIEGNLIGMGVELWAEDEELRIVEVFPGGPAYDSGLQPGDLILRIANTWTADIGAKRAADLLRGPENSQFSLVTQREGQPPVEMTVTRKRVDVPSVGSRSIVDKNAGVGYIRITNFQKTTPREVDEALWSLQRSGMKSLIIDLRRNPGGLLEAAVEIADRFLPSGSIVSTRGRNGIENHNYVARAPQTWDIPLVLLIDGDSASASEILAGAIRDHNRGVLVGQTTYGKGSVQGLFHTDTTDAGLRLTVSKFFSPRGYAISDRGIQPTIPISELTTSVKSDRNSKTIDPADGKKLVALKPSIPGDAVRPHDLRANNDDVALRAAIEAARKSTKVAQR